jgi:pimeloyl-ACP methyl ester carboxylesterase
MEKRLIESTLKRANSRRTPLPWEEITSAMSGDQLTYLDVGSGPAVLLLHGYPFDNSMWSDQIDFLSAHGYRVIAPDLPGFGKSTDKADRRIMSMANMARHVATLMDKLGIPNATICGLSMGGYVAFEFVNLFPRRTRALVLADTRAPADNEPEKQAREQQVAQMLAMGMVEIAEGSLPKLLAPHTLAEKPGVVARVREMILRADPKGAAAAQRGMAARRDYSADLPRIDIPVLIIVGRQDSIRPVTDAGFMHQGLSNSRLEIIEDAAHMTNMEQPEIFNRALQEFIGTHAV